MARRLQPWRSWALCPPHSTVNPFSAAPSRSLRRLANWGKAAAVRFAPSGERFAAVGEGGVVATWRLDAPSRQADGDGHGCAEWWHQVCRGLAASPHSGSCVAAGPYRHAGSRGLAAWPHDSTTSRTSALLPTPQALSKQGCAVDFVGGSSSVLVVGGRSLPTASAGSPSSNLSVWDTTAPTASSCVGRLTHHQVCEGVGGWQLGLGAGPHKAKARPSAGGRRESAQTL